MLSSGSVSGDLSAAWPLMLKETLLLSSGVLFPVAALPGIAFVECSNS